MHRVILEGRGDFEEWRKAARAFAMTGIPPEELEWHEKSDAPGFAFQRDVSPPEPGAGQKMMTVTPAFMALAEAVICHSDPRRFSLLYSLLWRLRVDRHLLDLASDEEVSRAKLMQKSVHRDAHKMTAFLRFKEVAGATGKRRKFIAWFEPDHYIVARKAPFFQRRFTDMDWLIATPKGSAAWDGERLTIGNASCEKPDISDVTDDLWRTYYASIFNPARLKIKAMQAEMPKKYWKNLPEADLIPGLIADAERRVLAMAERDATSPLPFHDRLQRRALDAQPAESAIPGTLAALRDEAAACTRCPLYAKATQTVFGEGPQDAQVMVVGEQPGDQEDLAGRPFVGPAGRVFDQAIEAAGIDRSALYVTNAVKHFKYEPRGKRRIHQRPNMGEVRHCRWWLDLEIALIKPKLVVAMGATALASLMESKERLADIRGRVMPLPDGRQIFVTIHPSYLLRLQDERQKEEELTRFHADIASVRSLMDGFAGSA
ncbi:MAG: UdgX family uracil-DNA binding protein [Rhizobiaceae bacterium]|nr:UdgX family uracil-DNA binding protein [Rhizobiaceae bacterium]